MRRRLDIASRRRASDPRIDDQPSPFARKARDNQKPSGARDDARRTGDKSVLERTQQQGSVNVMASNSPSAARRSAGRRRAEIARNPARRSAGRSASS
jgi:hypothetical protein